MQSDASCMAVAPSRFGSLRVGAGRDQQIGKFEVIAVSRPLDRRGAVGLRSVYVGFLLEQRYDTPRDRRSSPRPLPDCRWPRRLHESRANDESNENRRTA